MKFFFEYYVIPTPACRQARTSPEYSGSGDEESHNFVSNHEISHYVRNDKILLKV